MAKRGETDLSLIADNRIEFAMANAEPSIVSDGEVNVIEKHMDDELITDYAQAKSAVRQSFLGRMVGPAFVAGALAAAATMMPFPAGAEQMPQYLGDANLNPSVISAGASSFPTATQYFGEFMRNAVITGACAAGIPALLYKVDESRDSVHRPRKAQA